MQTTFAIDDRSNQAFEELKGEFGVSTKAAVIRRSLALARILVKHAVVDGIITVVRRDGSTHRILLTE